MRFPKVVWAAFVLAVGSSPAIAEDDSPMLAFSAGAADIFHNDTAAMVAAEYRSDYKVLIVMPMVGGFVTTDGSLYGYGGIYTDFDLGDQLVLRPSFAVGAYSQGDGKDLGGVLEFRTGIELAWRFENHTRLGLEFTHISNARIYDHNPGMETLTVNYSVPLDTLF